MDQQQRVVMEPIATVQTIEARVHTTKEYKRGISNYCKKFIDNTIIYGNLDLREVNPNRLRSRLLLQTRSTTFGENMSSKPVSVTDDDFCIRTPSFIVVYGYVLHVMAAQYNKEKILSVGDTVKYKQHGDFQICCTHESHAVIKHTTLSGKVRSLLVPDKQWLCVSNGTYKVCTPNYDSFLSRYKRLEKTVDAQRIWITYPDELIDKYHTMLDAFKGYWKENFDESVQENNDSCTFELGARIRYGMFCIMQGLPIPTECDYVTLVTEIDEWISYREGKYNT